MPPNLENFPDKATPGAVEEQQTLFPYTPANFDPGQLVKADGAPQPSRHPRPGINCQQFETWTADIKTSIAMFNAWFVQVAPQAYLDSKVLADQDVANLFTATSEMRNITPAVIKNDPSIIATLRMCTAPPIARDRLAGLTGAPPSLLNSLEGGQLPSAGKSAALDQHLESVCAVIDRMLDRALFDWLDGGHTPDKARLGRAAGIVSDRRCGALADPIVRNAQETRQLDVATKWLQSRGYTHLQHPPGVPINTMKPGTYAMRQNVPVHTDDGRNINMPIDLVIQPRTSTPPAMPLLVEAKSAGDFANTNKRRKEEATKARQLRATYGADVSLVLFLCGYFDTGYLGYEAAEGLDWVWEHRVEDFALANI